MSVLRIEEDVDQPLPRKRHLPPREHPPLSEPRDEVRHLIQFRLILEGDPLSPLRQRVALKNLTEGCNGFDEVGWFLVHVQPAEDRNEGPNLLVGDGRLKNPLTTRSRSAQSTWPI